MLIFIKIIDVFVKGVSYKMLCLLIFFNWGVEFRRSKM